MNPKKIEQVMASPRVVANLRRQFATDRDREVPDLSCCSRDGHTVYVDRDMPSTMMHLGHAVPITSYLVRRAQVEKAVIDASRQGDQVPRMIGGTKGSAREVATKVMEDMVVRDLGLKGLATFRNYIKGRDKDVPSPD